MKNIFITTVLIVASLTGFAQQDAMYTHYMFNTLSVNPAYAGTRDALTVTGLHRSQWVGFDGAPRTQTLTVHSPILNKNMGVGLSLVNDRIGPTKMTAVYVDFAYRIQVTDKAKLSIGLNGGLNIRSNDLTSIPIDDVTDETFAANEGNALLPNFGFGLYYYSDKYYVGISAPKLLKNSYTSNESTASNDLSSEERHYFLIAGMVFKLSESFKLKPTMLMKFTNGAPLQGDITGTVIFKDRIWAGLMYRSFDAAGALIGVYITPQLALGYSYDWSFGNETMTYNDGSHEIMLMYDFIFKDKSKIRSPRYF